MLAAQGTDLTAFNQKLKQDSTAGAVAELTADRAGYVSQCDARLMGEVIRDLGGGRLAQDAKIDYEVGVDRIAKPGERVVITAGVPFGTPGATNILRIAYV